MRLSKKAQAIADYVLLVFLITAAVVAMQVYVKRGVQAKIRDMTDVFLPAGRVDAGARQLANVNPVIPISETGEETDLSGESGQGLTNTVYIYPERKNDIIVYASGTTPALLHNNRLISGWSRLAVLDPAKELPVLPQTSIPSIPALPSQQIPEAPTETTLLAERPQDPDLQPSASQASRDAKENVQGITVSGSDSGGYTASGYIIKEQLVTNKDGTTELRDIRYGERVTISGSGNDVTYASSRTKGFANRSPDGDKVKGSSEDTHSPETDLNIDAQEQIDAVIANPATKEQEEEKIKPRVEETQAALGQETDTETQEEALEVIDETLVTLNGR